MIQNTFQCVLTTNGESTFAFFLYADGLVNSAQNGLFQIGIDGGDRINYYTVPGSRPPIVNDVNIISINFTYTSNVNLPGLWIFKLDDHIIAGTYLYFH